MTGDGEWAEAYKRATEFVSKLTLPEKVNLTTGAGCVLPLEFTAIDLLPMWWRDASSSD